ncbi:MAG: 2-succinyl-6-hydroxy-2,4-cyclohexadiene-1-carboxylate synthase [bacterium]|nr:2-succinyl-6-hydroxy-2,4-cyclohexadiene-1-carboxylate synthase [bacterium]
MKRVVSSFVDAQGVRIHARIVPGPDPEATAIVILHGFTGSTESMRGVVAELCETRTTVCVDLVGHGCSDAPEDVAAYSMDRCAAQLACVVDELALDRPHLLGYSMGGRAALAFCTAYPERASSALLVGASAGLADPEVRSQRVREDEALADRILTGGLEAFVAEWMAKPIFASQVRLGEAARARSRDQRLRNRPHGLALSLRGMGTGAMTPLELAGLKVPTCFVAGAEDEKFCAIARAYAERLPASRFEIVACAGHAAHLENQEAFGFVARDFFADIDTGRA